MADWWAQIRSAFRSGEQSQSGNPALHELLVRSAAAEVAYDNWKKTSVSQGLLDWLATEYDNFQARKKGDPALAFLNTNSSKGVIFYFGQTSYQAEDVQHFFYLLKERVQALDYRVALSDRRMYNRKHWVEMLDRHYLKPRQPYVAGQLLRQAFGNITISLEYRDDQIHHLRLQATVYHDALYEKGAPFAALVKQITSTDN